MSGDQTAIDRNMAQHHWRRLEFTAALDKLVFEEEREIRHPLFAKHVLFNIGEAIHLLAVDEIASVGQLDIH